MKRIKLLIACGGTGGHIFPAAALADSLTKDYPESAILFAGSFDNRMQELLKSKGYDTVLVKGYRMPHYFNVLIFPFLINMFLSISHASRILKNWQPDIVVSMGSFSGGPFAVAGRINRYSVLIHEQNLMPGRANRISAYFADRVATSFAATANFFPESARRKIIWTGNPVRKEIIDMSMVSVGNRHACSLRYFGLDPNKFTILVMGGSQGSHRLNDIFAEVAGRLDKNSFQVLHLAGNADFDFLSKEYQRIDIKNRVFTFLDNMGEAYAASDLIICRSGATTIAEITAWGLASILIPYPYGDAHQKANADVLRDSEAGIVIQQWDLTADTLFKVIMDLLGNRDRLEQMRQKSKKLARPDAAERLAEEVVRLFSQNRLSSL